MKKRRNYFIFGGILLFVIGWSILLLHISPKEIVSYIGAENSLIVAFGVSTFGGLSSLTSTSYYAMLTTLSTGGANPLLLGISAGAGLTISDSLIYYLGTRGHEILTGDWRQRADQISRWINTQHEHVVQIFAYVYTGLTPLPNDLLTGSLGLAEYSYRRLLPALLLGNITLSILIAEFAVRSDIIGIIFG